jgi:hypothetical protein
MRVLARSTATARGGAVLASLVAIAIGIAAMPATAPASRACGSFRVSGLGTSVKVRVVRGATTCREANRVMRSLFAHKRSAVFGWRCVGPQTGYSACTKGSAKITGLF